MYVAVISDVAFVPIMPAALTAFSALTLLVGQQEEHLAHKT